MVGIVIVSHSSAVAEGVRELALQMAQGKVNVSAAGGIEDEASPFGTDPFQIKLAIERAYSPEGVLVLMDMGSAIMNSELAIELLDEALKDAVCLCEAPLIEGAIAAVAQASAGASLAEVMREAQQALDAKQSLLSLKGGAVPVIDEVPLTGQTFDVTVPNSLGLHARPAARLVQLLRQYDDRVEIKVKGLSRPFVNAASISQVGTLGATYGDILTFWVDGYHTEEIKQELLDFAAQNFGDEEMLHEEKSSTTSSKGIIQNHKIGISSGIAIGKARVIKQDVHQIDQQPADDTDAELTQLTHGIEAVRDTLAAMVQSAGMIQGESPTDLFRFHMMILDDAEVITQMRERITARSFRAAYACFDVYTELSQQYRDMQTSYLKERASDIQELRDQLVREIKGMPKTEIFLREPAILVVDELGPAQTLALDLSKVLGIISAGGGETSHASILARAMGIPAIIGAAYEVDQMIDGELIAMDGTTGHIWLERNDPEAFDQVQQKKDEAEEQQKRLMANVPLDATSIDGQSFHLLANVSGPAEARLARQYGANGIGLYRTEFLFMAKDRCPSEEDQYQVYREVCEGMRGYPITFRTLDIGGDKPISYLSMTEEVNPFLGLRGIRYSLSHPDLFKTQLSAICRLSADYDVQIMYPMVSTFSEVLSANQLLREAQQELAAQRIPFRQDMPVGVMVEVPSMLFLLEDVAEEIDFISLGTNDLTQYLLAIDRDNPRVAPLYDGMSPAVLRAIDQVIRDAQRLELDVSICGELGSKPEAIQVLASMGIRKISMSGPAIPVVKDFIRSMDVCATSVNSFK